jgi:hypothetical protein
MRHIPCIPNELLSAENRQRLYALEATTEISRREGRVVALINPQDVAEVLRYLLTIVDGLAGAYLDMARERDKWKGAMDLALDGNFWISLEAVKK